jgi:hypothetical protein
MGSREKVAVIGAGAAGLAAARQIILEGFEPVIFEAESRLGGTWNYTEELESDPLGRDPDRYRVHTSMYADLRTNLPRDLMAFREFPFDGLGGGDEGRHEGRDEGLRFPPHIDVLRYLERYAESFSLVDRIRFACRVDNLVPLDASGGVWIDRGDEPAGWLVCSTDAGGSPREEQFHAVAIGNGHYAFPRVPDLDGADLFEGRQLHSHSYRHPENYRDQRVVVLGARASGIDIALEIGKCAREVYLCARGVERRQSFFGRKNLSLGPSIESLEKGSTAVLSDESRIEEIGTLLYCTGYEYRLPFLDPAGVASPVVTVDDNWIHPLFLDLLAARAPTLGMIGLGNHIVPFPQYELQAKFYARMLAGRVAVPERVERERLAGLRVAEQRASGVAQRYFLQQGDAQFAYNDELARRSGVELLPPSFKEVYKAVEQARFRDPENYRDKDFPWVRTEGAQGRRTDPS